MHSTTLPLVARWLLKNYQPLQTLHPAIVENISFEENKIGTEDANKLYDDIFPMHDYCCWLCLKLVVKKIALISCYFQANCLSVSKSVSGFYISIFCQSSRWFSYCYLTGSCRNLNEKILFFSSKISQIYNSWRHNKSEPLQELG